MNLNFYILDELFTWWTLRIYGTRIYHRHKPKDKPWSQSERNLAIPRFVHMFVKRWHSYAVQANHTRTGVVLYPAIVHHDYVYGSVWRDSRHQYRRLPQALFYLSGILCWQYFSDCLNKTSNTFLNNQGIFGKVYFPRLIVLFGCCVQSVAAGYSPLISDCIRVVLFHRCACPA